MRYLTPFLLLALACAGGPEVSEAEEYSAQMQPILSRNATLAQRFLTEASHIKKKQVTGDALSATLATELTPEADALAKAVAAVDPSDPKLSDIHAGLESAWTKRAQAYGEMQAAYATGDLASWDAAMAKNAQSKVDEERYFSDVNAWLAPHEQVLVQFPR